MAEKSSMNKILNWKLGQIKQLRNKLKKVVDSYVSKITESAQMWIDRCEDYNQYDCFQVSTQLDQAMFILTEKISEIESKLVSQLLDAGTLETTLKAATNLSFQTSVGSQAIDQPLSSLQERIHSLESALGSVQAGLDQCRKQIGSVEGIKANLENLASQVEVITNDKSVQQIQQEIEHYTSKEVVRIQNYDDRLSKIEKTLSTTDNQMKDLSVLSKSITEKTDCRVTVMEEKLTEIKEENKQVKLCIDGVISDSKMGGNVVTEIQEKLTTMDTKMSKITENNLQSLDVRLQLLEEDKKAGAKTENSGVGEENQAMAVNKKETQPRSTFTGFIASGTSTCNWGGFKLVTNFDIIAISTDALFNKSTGEFTAPVDGTYMVIFIQKRIGGTSTTVTFKITHLKEIHKNKKCVLTSSTDKQNNQSVVKSQVDMSAGDRLCLSLTRGYNVEIPVFCCVLIE